MRASELAIITGGSRGIGHFAVQSLLKQMDVLNISRNPACNTKGDNKGKLFNLCIDLGNVESASKHIDNWFQENRNYSTSTIIFNAATIELGWLSSSKTVIDKLERVFRVNVQAPIAISSRVLELEVFSESGARIIYVTSSLARPVPELTFAGLARISHR